jgi:hypothetical protein
MLFETHLEVKLSTIPGAGNGVFTLKDIKQGEPVCYYAGRDEPAEKNSQDPYAIHHMFNNTVRVGFRVPEKSHGVAQLVNDASYLDFNSLELNENGLFPLCAIKKLEDDYNKCSYEKMNVCYDKYGEEYVMYARQNIKAGEELFVSYGTDYWISQFDISCDYPLRKLLIYRKNIKQIIDSKNDQDAMIFMKSLRILNNGVIYQTLGVDPYIEEHLKLKYITEQVIRCS